jgi:RimJ/RimL family protein N-acetyltransferase
MVGTISGGFPLELITQRTRLRRPGPDDAEAIFQRYASSPEVTQYMSFPTHRGIEETRAFLARANESWNRGTAFPYLIERRADALLLGATGLHIEAAHRYMTGYVLARDAWGQGYATEVLTAMLELAFSRPEVCRVYALCDVEHVASARVMEKCGMQREGVLRSHTVLPNRSPEPRDVLCYSKVRGTAASPVAGGVTVERIT